MHCINVQLILLVDIFASDSSGISANGCGALEALLQFTAVAQFLWIAAMVSEWVISKDQSLHISLFKHL